MRDEIERTLRHRGARHLRSLGDHGSGRREWSARRPKTGSRCGKITSIPRSSIRRPAPCCPTVEFGELVLTTLTKEALPAIRYRTRDLTRLLPGTARPMRRLQRITGRSDDMLIVRGVNVFPSQLEELIVRDERLSAHYQIHLRAQRPARRSDAARRNKSGRDRGNTCILRLVARRCHQELCRRHRRRRRRCARHDSAFARQGRAYRRPPQPLTIVLGDADLFGAREEFADMR